MFFKYGHLQSSNSCRTRQSEKNIFFLYNHHPETEQELCSRFSRKEKKHEIEFQNHKSFLFSAKLLKVDLELKDGDTLKTVKKSHQLCAWLHKKSMNTFEIHYRKHDMINRTFSTLMHPVNATLFLKIPQRMSQQSSSILMLETETHMFFHLIDKIDIFILLLWA